MTTKHSLKVHVSEIIRFAVPDDPWMRIHVKMELGGDDPEVIWDGQFGFMLPDKDMLLSEIEKVALERVTKCISSVVPYLDAQQ